ncbi:MAG: hypothetical protein V7647_1767 [Acidobacteriota bacterium]|jgi:hypothetical protein
MRIAHNNSAVLSLLLCGAAMSLAAQRATAPIVLVQGTEVGAPTFAPGDTPTGGNGQPVDGIEGSSREMLSVHIHAHLALFSKGRQIAVPYGIGIIKPFQLTNGFVGMGNGFYWLHTHDATGILHIESPDARAYTLGNFFDIWGQPLSAGEVAGLKGPVSSFVDGKPYRGDPRGIVLGAHMQITLEVGDPVVPPPVYVFPNGL